MAVELLEPAQRGGGGHAPAVGRALCAAGSTGPAWASWTRTESWAWVRDRRQRWDGGERRRRRAAPAAYGEHDVGHTRRGPAVAPCRCCRRRRRCREPCALFQQRARARARAWTCARAWAGTRARAWPRRASGAWARASWAPAWAVRGAQSAGVTAQRELNAALFVLSFLLFAFFLYLTTPPIASHAFLTLLIALPTRPRPPLSLANTASVRLFSTFRIRPFFLSIARALPGPGLLSSFHSIFLCLSLPLSLSIAVLVAPLIPLDLPSSSK